jgi:hypothetical protein
MDTEKMKNWIGTVGIYHSPAMKSCMGYLNEEDTEPVLPLAMQDMRPVHPYAPEDEYDRPTSVYISYSERRLLNAQSNEGKQLVYKLFEIQSRHMQTITVCR